jgi:homoserine/homoserine lactone efflux protein
MPLNLWILFAITELVGCLTPGPAVLLVISHGMTWGGRSSLAANAGILAGNALYFVLSALGLGAILLASHEFFTAVKYAGAGYLIYLGVQTIRGAGVALQPHGRVHGGTGRWRTMARGFALQIANPKALIFFVALLPQFLDPTRPIGRQIVLLGLTSVVIEFVVLAGYGYLAAGAMTLARRPRFVAATNRVSGGMLVLAGTGIAISGEGR